MTVSVSRAIALLSYAIVLCGVLPLVEWLSPLSRVVLAAGGVAAVLQERPGAKPIRNWILNLMAVPLVILFLSRFSTANPVQPVVGALGVMVAVRLAGEKNPRHYLQLYVLSLFCLASSSLFELTPLFLLYLALMLFLIPLSLVLLSFCSHDSSMVLTGRNLRRVLFAGLAMPLASLPLVALFFAILPRTQIPLWNILPASGARSSGYTDRVEPGTSSAIGESAVTVFRAEMPRVQMQQLYWRGTVFNLPRGNRWTRDERVPPEQLIDRGERVRQIIFPEPSRTQVPIALDVPVELRNVRSRRLADGTFEGGVSGGRRRSYGAVSVIAGELRTAGIEREFYLRLPPDLSPRIRSLAARIGRSGASDGQKISELERFFRSGGFSYSLRGLPTGGDALEKFLFTERSGHCEFFASSFALLARGAGVPARLVGGYLGGEYNDMGGYYLISERMAHVWVEVYDGGRKSWLRVDPSSFAVNAGALLGASPTKDIRRRLRMVLDSLDHAWNRSVITYDFERQADAVRSLGASLKGFTGRKYSLPWWKTASVTLALSLLFTLLLAGRWFVSPEERLLRAFYRRLEKDTGNRPEPGRGLFEIASANPNRNLKEFVHLYGGAVYGDRKLTHDERRRLSVLIRAGFREEPDDPS